MLAAPFTVLRDIAAFFAGVEGDKYVGKNGRDVNADESEEEIVMKFCPEKVLCLAAGGLYLFHLGMEAREAFWSGGRGRGGGAEDWHFRDVDCSGMLLPSLAWGVGY